MIMSMCAAAQFSMAWQLELWYSWYYIRVILLWTVDVNVNVAY